MTSTATATGRPASFIAIPEDIRAFIDDIRFATIATVDPDGSPRQAVVWYTVDGDEIVLNSAVGRHWPSNLLRDPHLAFSVVDVRDGYRWIGLRGVTSAVTDQTVAQADIADMAHRYHAAEPGKADRLIERQFQRQDRISFRMRVTSAMRHFD